MRVTTSVLSASRSTSNPFQIIERLLRERNSVWQQIHSDYQLNELIGQMLISSLVSLASYGAVMGFMGLWSGTLLQTVASAIKLPLLFLLTLAICLPTLYIFNLVLGAQLSVRQALALVMAGITVTAVMTLAFAPISLFFLLTARDYDFFKLLNVGILGLSGVVGLSFLNGGMVRMNGLSLANDQRRQERILPATDDSTAEIKTELEDLSVSQELPKQVNLQLLWIWMILYAFVGTQLAWTLRPFFGDPDQPFAIFRTLEGNFYVNIFHTIINMMSGL